MAAVKPADAAAVAGPASSPVARIGRWMPRILLAVMCVYVVVAVVLGPGIMHNLYRHSDTPDMAIIGRGWINGLGPSLNPTNTNVVVEVYDALVSRTPWFRLLVMISGPLLSLLTALVMWRTARRAVGREGAWITPALLIGVGPVIVATTYAQENHDVTRLMTAVMAWHLTTVARRSRWRAAGISVVMGILAGVAVVNDPQAYFSLALPALATLLFLRMRLPARRDVPLLTAAVALPLVLVAVCLPPLMHAAGIVIGPGLASETSVTAMLRGIRLGFSGLAWMAGGLWYGAPWNAAYIPGVVVALFALMLPFVVLRVQVLRHDDGRAPEASIHAVYWIMSAFALGGAFLLSGESRVPQDTRYIVGLYFAAAALAAHMVRREVRPLTRLITYACATIAVAAATVGIALTPAVTYADGLPSSDDAAMASALQARHLDHGYADYWDAYDITWLSGDRLNVWPVLSQVSCRGTAAGELCPYGELTAAGAYRGRPGTTFVLVRSAGAGCVHLAPPVATFGSPMETFSTGNLTAYVFSYDVAARFVANRYPGCLS